MNRDEKTLARYLFMNKVYSANGQAYEDLFCAVMSKAYKDFIPIKPQGKFGDRKNDGYRQEAGSYYQIYAPEDPKASIHDAIKKAEHDFNGLLTYWHKISPIKEYYFVLNDKYQGPYPTVEQILVKIKDTNKLKKTGVFLAKHLEDVFFSLEDDVIQSIIGFIPDPNNIAMIDYRSLREVINHILQNRKPTALEASLSVPDFDEKIKFNGLGKRVKLLLDNACYQLGILDEYFYRHGASIKKDLRDRLNETYITSKNKDYGTIPDDMTHGDLVFFDILHSLVPKNTRAAEDAAIILMAKYFESCDIFEEPI